MTAIVGKDGPLAGRRIEINKEITFGRQNVDVVIKDSEVSRRHAAIRIRDQGVEIEDLGSRNGTFVNDVRVTGRMRLTQGDAIRIGSSTFEVEREWQAAETSSVPIVRSSTVRVSSTPQRKPGETALRATDELPSQTPRSEPDAPDRRKMWIVVAAMVAGVAVIAFVVMSLLGGDDPKKDAGDGFSVAANALCGKAAKRVKGVDLKPRRPVAGLRSDLRKLLGLRAKLLGALDRLKPRPPAARAFLGAFRKTNASLRRYERVTTRKKTTLRGLNSARLTVLNDLQRERAAGTDAGLRECVAVGL